RPIIRPPCGQSRSLLTISRSQKEHDLMKAGSTLPVVVVTMLGAAGAAETSGVAKLLSEPAVETSTSLLTLPALTVTDTEGPPLKSPSVADDDLFTTAITSPAI